jgi:hypothetical protein
MRRSVRLLRLALFERQMSLFVLLCLSLFAGAFMGEIAQAAWPAPAGLTISGRVINSTGVGVSGIKIESTGSVRDGVLTALPIKSDLPLDSCREFGFNPT